jgi:hypothetical protein
VELCRWGASRAALAAAAAAAAAARGL